ncbi:DgyrCDS11889 [Dimorphilus gyrociliatus]|uniref:DgyrCDS11889 n=1 Tax=Dimorphilus gyrociliatus TaxID=2664684 RepID=A0A7I8W8D2_9ANNE|nr:DgyrCDS11889 [Dimorphilus gyrociliatus]
MREETEVPYFRDSAFFGISDMSAKKDKQKTSYFLTKITRSLLELKCPFIEDFTESWVGELLLSPNEVRFRILKWLFETLDPSLSLILDSEKNFGNFSNEKIRNLLFVSTLLGLCKREDIDLITGSCPPAKQLLFFRKLIKYVEIKEKYDRDFLVDIGDRLHPSLADQYEENCKFIDVLSRGENFDDLFAPDVHIVPISIEKSIHNRWKQQGYNINDPAIPDLTQLDKSLNNCDIVSRYLVSHNREENKQPEINIDQINIERGTNEDRERLLKQLEIEINEVSQQISMFSQTFDSDIFPWCGRNESDVGDFNYKIGSVVKRVNNKLEYVSEIVSNLRTTVEYHKQLKTIRPEALDYKKANHQLLLDTDLLTLKNGCNRGDFSETKRLLSVNEIGGI